MKKITLMLVSGLFAASAFATEVAPVTPVKVAPASSVASPTVAPTKHVAKKHSHKAKKEVKPVVKTSAPAVVPAPVK